MSSKEGSNPGHLAAQTKKETEADDSMFNIETHEESSETHEESSDPLSTGEAEKKSEERPSSATEMVINRIGAASEVPPPMDYHPSGREVPRNIAKSITRTESSQPRYESSEANPEAPSPRYNHPLVRTLPGNTA